MDLYKACPYLYTSFIGVFLSSGSIKHTGLLSTKLLDGSYQKIKEPFLSLMGLRLEALSSGGLVTCISTP
jgi:hypothetical protein